MEPRLRNRSSLLPWLRAEGWTLMIVRGPTRQTRRVHVPRWAVAVLCCAWLGVMLGAGWLGFRSAEPRGLRYDEHQSGARVATGPLPLSRQ